MNGQIKGQVRMRPSGQPAAAATVLLRPVHAGQALQPTAVRTRADGWFFSMPLAPGMWQVQAAGGPAVECEVLAHGSTAVQLELPAVASPCDALGAATATGSVRGQVLDARVGTAVADATVLIVNGHGASPDIAPITGEDGRFVLDNLAAGLWIVRAIAPDAATGENVVAVRGGATSELVIEVGADAPTTTY